MAATIDWRDIPDSTGKTYWEQHPGELDKIINQATTPATEPQPLPADKPMPIPEGQIDWRNIPDATGKTYWDYQKEKTKE
jgi:hypothetical protein